MEALTTEQIDALLAGISSNYERENTNIPVPTLSEEEKEKRRQDRILYRNLSRILERYVPSLQEGLRNVLPSSKVDVELVHLEEQRLSELVNALPEEFICTFKISNLKGRCILDVPNELYKEFIRQNYIDTNYLDPSLNVNDIFYNVLFRIGDIFDNLYKDKLNAEQIEINQITIDMLDSLYPTELEVNSLNRLFFPLDEVVIISVFDITVDDQMFCITLAIPMCMLEGCMDSLLSEEFLTQWFYK